MGQNAEHRSFLAHARTAMGPEPAPVLLRVGIAVVIDMIVVLVAVRSALVLAGHPTEGLTHAVLPAVFGGMFAFLLSLGGSAKSGLLRALVFSLFSLPLTLIAIVVRPYPFPSAVALAFAAVLTGMLAWYGQPLATVGVLLLYTYFVPFVFGAGSGVPMGYLLLSFGVMTVCTVVLRAVIVVIPKKQAPPRVKTTGGDVKEVPLRQRFHRVPDPQLSRLQRTTIRSAIGLGVGAFVVSATRDHQAVWVLMTLIALIPPSVPLTIDRVLQRLAGTVVAMVALTVIDVLVPLGSGRLLLLTVGIVLTVAFIQRSYLISVLGISCAAVLGYAQVHGPLGEALLWRGFDTLVGAVIAIIVTLLMPVGRTPKPVWAHDGDTASK